MNFGFMNDFFMLVHLIRNHTVFLIYEGILHCRACFKLQNSIEMILYYRIYIYEENETTESCGSCIRERMLYRPNACTFTELHGTQDPSLCNVNL